jgi:hypothetical protein
VYQQAIGDFVQVIETCQEEFNKIAVKMPGVQRQGRMLFEKCQTFFFFAFAGGK